MGKQKFDFNTIQDFDNHILKSIHEAQKTTCLWLKGLPLLQHFKEVDLFGKGEFYEFTTKNGVKKKQPMWFAKAFLNKDNSGRAKERAFRYVGVAKAMAEQWG